MVKDLYTKDKQVINEIRKLSSNLVFNKKIRFDKLSNKAFKEPSFFIEIRKNNPPKASLY